MPDNVPGNVTEECEMDGAVLLIIRLQRWCGMAPVHITKRGSKYFVSTCRLYLYLGYIFAIIHCVLLLAAMIWDIAIKDTRRKVNFWSSSKSVLWVLNVVSCSVTYMFGCFGAEKRMIDLMSCLKEINQINLLVKDRKDQYKKKENNLSILLNCFWLAIIIVLECYVASVIETKKNAEMIIFYLNTFENTRYIQILLKGLSYTYVVKLFNMSHHFINRRLEEVLSDVKNNVSENREVANSREDPPLKISTKLVNRAIDQLGITKLKRPESALSEEKEDQLHQLLRQQDRVCVQISLFNKRDGMLLLCVTYNYIICFLAVCYNAISTIYLAENIDFWVYFYCDQVLWLLFVIFNASRIVNACQRTTTEMSETKRLVSCLMSHVANGNEPLFNILDSYYHYLRLDNVEYSPLGLFQLNKKYIFETMGGIVTYLLIFIDFNVDFGFAKN